MAEQIPLSLIDRITQAESGGDPNATSPAGAQGLMQLMPGTAQEVGVTNRKDPVQSVNGGTVYLGKLLKRFDGDENKAVAAYNWGPAKVERLVAKHGDGWFDQPRLTPQSSRSRLTKRCKCTVSPPRPANLFPSTKPCRCTANRRSLRKPRPLKVAAGNKRLRMSWTP
jgi:membrane-bound lytic murein transglycosylase MltF